MRRWPAAAAAALCLVLAAPALAQDDAVELTASGPAVVQKGASVKVSVDVRAQAGALDIADGPLRLQVRVAPVCGASFGTTVGTTMIDAALSPVPTAGQAYSGTFSGAAKLRSYGVQSVCAFLDQGDGLQLASDTEAVVDVSKRCTTAHKTLSTARRNLRVSKRQRAKTHSLAVKRKLDKRIVTRRRAVAKAQKRATSICKLGG